MVNILGFESQEATLKTLCWYLYNNVICNCPQIQKPFLDRGLICESHIWPPGCLLPTLATQDELTTSTVREQVGELKWQEEDLGLDSIINGEPSEGFRHGSELI